MTIRKSGEVSSDFVALGKSREKYSNFLVGRGAICGFRQVLAVVYSNDFSWLCRDTTLRNTPPNQIKQHQHFRTSSKNPHFSTPPRTTCSSPNNVYSFTIISDQSHSIQFDSSTTSFFYPPSWRCQDPPVLGGRQTTNYTPSALDTDDNCEL